MSAMRLTMAWIAWAISRVGRPGRIGALLLLLGVVTCATLVRSLEGELETVRARIERLSQQPPPPPREVAEQDWIAHLPVSHAGYAHLAPLFTAANSAGLGLEEGRYREIRDAGSGLTRLFIVLPVSGRYPAIRAFLSQALDKEPSLALEGARFTRDGIGDGEINAELRLVLFLAGRP